MILLDILNEFTYSAYRRLLRYLSTKWVFVRFLDAYENAPEYPYIMLRHDLDSLPETALNMAKIENRYDIESTYFFSCSSPLYNIRDPQVTGVIREISSLGHDIGLHYDIDVYRKYSKSVISALSASAHLLGEVVGGDVEVISRHSLREHRPIRGSQFVEVYEDIPFDCYVSDSCRKWSKNTERIFSKEPLQIIHLLIHPPLWSLHPMSETEVFNRIFDSTKDRIDKEKIMWSEKWSNR